jgi:Tol biopolymer transport system component
MSLAKRRRSVVARGLAVLLLVVAGVLVVIDPLGWRLTRSPTTSRTTPESESASADYEKQHALLLVNETPALGQPGGATTSPIYVIHGDGVGKTLLTSDGGAPSWTPDGKVIFVSSRSGSQQVWVMDDNGRNALQIGALPPNMLPVMPQMGRNGLIVFMGADADTNAGGDTNVGIWIMQKDGSALRELTRGMQPSLALSGAWIAYTFQLDNPYHREIWRINTDGTNLKQLTFLGDPNYPDANAPNISPDESMVAFFSGKESDRAPAGLTQSVFTFGHRNVAVVRAEGGTRKTLTPCHPVTTQAEIDATNDCIAADNPAWTPDGKWLIFDTGFKTGTETWLVDLNGQNFQQIYPQSRGIVRIPLKFTN